LLKGFKQKLKVLNYHTQTEKLIKEYYFNNEKITYCSQ